LREADADEPQRVCSGILQTELRQNAHISPQSLRPLLRTILEMPSRPELSTAACVLIFSLALHQSRVASNRHCQDSLKSTVSFSGRSLPDGSGLESDMRFCSALSWAEAGFCIGLFAVQALARADDDPNRAQFLASCGTCHSVEPGAEPRQGPNLNGIFGRKAGSVDGFKYSDALKTADWIWDEGHLDSWIENAQAMRPGVFMPYRQADPAKRAKVIAFLKSLGTSK
jgi:cytochrome c